jgi:hypothetical protein
MINTGLNQKQELFCRLYTGQESPCFGNGVRAYAEAYRIDILSESKYNVAKSNASEILTKPYIQLRILELWGMDKEVVHMILDSKLMEIALGENHSLALRAINVFHRLEGRISPRKQDSKETVLLKFVPPR